MCEHNFRYPNKQLTMVKTADFGVASKISGFGGFFASKCRIFPGVRHCERLCLLNALVIHLIPCWGADGTLPLSMRWRAGMIGLTPTPFT
jgi:hypothetical protein